MKQHPIWYMIIGIFMLIVPTIVYLCFLIPSLSEEYNVLMLEGGTIGGAGLYGASKIPEEMKFSKLFKTAANAYATMAMIILVKQFIGALIGLAAVFTISFVIYKILKEAYKNGTARKQNTELATEIARSLNKVSK